MTVWSFHYFSYCKDKLHQRGRIFYIIQLFQLFTNKSLSSNHHTWYEIWLRFFISVKTNPEIRYLLPGNLLTTWLVESLSGVICIIYTIYLGYDIVSIRTFNRKYIIIYVNMYNSTTLVTVCCSNIMFTERSQSGGSVVGVMSTIRH